MKNICMNKNSIVNNFLTIHPNQQVVGIMVKENNYSVYSFLVNKPLLITVF